MNDKRRKRNKSLDCIPTSRFDNLVRNCGRKAQGVGTQIGAESMLETQFPSVQGFGASIQGFGTLVQSL
jgi:hypothetical protein